MWPESVSLLLLEGDRSVSRSIQFLLRKGNAPTFRIDSSETLRGGLERLSARQFDAVLLDLNLSDSKGLATMEEVRSRFPGLPVVVLVSHAQEAAGQRALRAGASDYLLKEGLSPWLLRRALRYAVESARATEELRQNEQRLRELFENSPDIFFTMDEEGNITSLNKSAELNIGCVGMDDKPMNIRNVVAPEYVEVCLEMLGRALKGEPAPVCELAVLCRDGGRIIVEVSNVFSCQLGDKRGVQGIARDITERRNLENLLRQSQKLEAVGRLSGGLAHDFNNLLCAIGGHSELLAERLEPGHPAVSNLAQIRKAADSAAALIRQLLAFSRQQVFYPKVVNLNTIVKEVETLFGRLMGEHIEFVNDLDPTLGHVRVDPHQFEQVLVNLLLNGRDAMVEGGTLKVTTSEVNLEGDFQSRHGIVPPGRYVVLAVSDTGMGMDEETQNRLFEPFFTTKELGKGTGLGLATVYGIVKQSGGFIWVYSELGRGTTFKIYMPREEEALSPLPAKSTSRNSFRGNETVLVVEDAEPLRTLTREFLTGCGYTVLEAIDGREALELVRDCSTPIHLLVTDLVMPGISGRQLAEELTARDPHLAVLYMSGYSNDRVMPSGVLTAGAAFLEKPFSREALLRKVRQLLDAVPVTV
jgi:PAS domain S-box-containing protein